MKPLRGGREGGRGEGEGKGGGGVVLLRSNIRIGTALRQGRTLEQELGQDADIQKSVAYARAYGPFQVGAKLPRHTTLQMGAMHGDNVPGKVSGSRCLPPGPSSWASAL